MSIIEQPRDARGDRLAARLVAIVAIPVQNERDRVAACLDALAGQTGIAPDSLGLLLFLNNCTDGTRTIVEAFARTSPWQVRILDEAFVSATAGWARRKAMDAAADWLDQSGSAQDGTLLTSDADSRVGADWVARNLAALANGVDAVAGRVAWEPAELACLPKALRERQTLEAAYEAQLAEIDAWINPQPGDPWPSHWTRSGATLALRLSAYRRIGGVPRCDSGEDDALVEAVRTHGLAVRHDPDIVVLTSSRLVGRARDGAADTLRRWSESAETACGPRLERLDRAIFRMLCRRRRRASARQALPYRPLRPSQLPRQIARARLLLGLIRHLASRRTSSRYASVREPSTGAAQPRAACKKRVVASSPVKG